MDFLPVFMDLHARPCLVVGAGAVGTGKAGTLLDAGARVRVVAPVVSEGMQALADTGRLELHLRDFQSSDLDGMRLVIAATDDAAVNAGIVQVAQASGVLANSVTGPARGDFIMPAIIDRSPVLAAVSTGGLSPVLSRLLRARLESLLPSGLGRLANLVARCRREVSARFPRLAERRAFWDEVLRGPVAELVYAGKEMDAEAALRAALARSPGTRGMGEVYLVGAGPGDPELLSFRAMRLIQQADVVVHDRLVSPEVLALVRRDAERVYAGKRGAQHAIDQEDINSLLVRLAREGRRVLRLKGGDPFIFGRGGEEIATLAAARVPFQVVPGITAASGCAAYAGIPLTHRDHASACLFVTGDLKGGKVHLDWPALVRPRCTLVIYMGLSALPVIAEQLVAHGLDPATPAALVEQGTTVRQRVVEATIATLADAVADAGARAPTLIIVGTVVRLRASLHWFEPQAQVAEATAEIGLAERRGL